MQELSNLTMLSLLERSFERYKDSIAVSFIDADTFTYEDMRKIIASLALYFSKRGIKQGDKVAILGENSPKWGIVYMALTANGIIAVPILPDFHKSEVHHILRNSGAKALFTTNKLVHKIVETKFSDLKLVVGIDDFDKKNIDCKVEFLSDIIKKPPADDEIKNMKPAKIEENDLAEILYTSGTTGHSKGVMLTHKNIVSNALQALNTIRIDNSDIMLSILPMSHSYECTCGFVAPIAAGAQIYYIKGLPTAQTLLPALEKIRPTILLSVPLIMEKIWKKKVLGEIGTKPVVKDLYKVAAMRKVLNKVAGKKLYQAFGGNMRFICFGGAALNPEVEKFLVESGFPYTTGYGLTESAPILTVNPLENVRFMSCGKAVRDVELRIADPDTETGVGEILARGPNIMQGYYKNPDATKDTLLEGGWLATGDRGYLDDDGYLFIKGRSKNVIVGPSGENIFPEEIEAKLGKNNLVLESLVYNANKRLVARVHLDYDLLDQEYQLSTMDDTDAANKIQELLDEIKIEVNAQVSSFSRINDMIEQREPFEMTPTKKIKRYLYITE